MRPASRHQPGDARTLSTLNALLKGEIAAVETYTQAIAKIDDRRLSPLQDNLDNHARRVIDLRNRITALGGTPVESSGAWGAFVRLIEGSAALLGRDTAIAALEEGEDRGLRDYREALPGLDERTRTWMEEELLPAQIRTHAVMREASRLGNGPGPGPGAAGMMPTFLMSAAICFAALSAIGCQEERKVSLEQVTPEARTTITKLVGTGQVTTIEEVTSKGTDVVYRVEIIHDGKREHYLVNGYGLLQD